MSNFSLLLNRRLATTVTQVCETNTRLSNLVNADAINYDTSPDVFHALLREQREQVSLAQEMIADRMAGVRNLPKSRLSVDSDQLQRLAVELGRMGDLVDGLLSVAARATN